MRRRGPEAGVQQAILDLLTAEGVWHLRMNTGAMTAEHNGRRRFVQFNTAGTGDILADHPVHRFWWIEVKAERGRQSEAQREFQQLVEMFGHKYTLARSVDDVLAVLHGGA
jgi:hypothetical protein